MAFGYSLWYIHGTPTFYVGDDKSATQNECVAFSSDFQCPSAPRFYGILKSLNPTSLSDSPKIILYSPIKHKTILANPPSPHHTNRPFITLHPPTQKKTTNIRPRSLDMWTPRKKIVKIRNPSIITVGHIFIRPGAVRPGRARWNITRSDR